MQTKYKYPVLSAILLITTIALASCGNPKQENGAENIQTEEILEEAVSAAPDFLFKDKDGNSVTLSSLKGKVVFMNFWATWCAPCIQEMPSINKLKQSFNGSEDIVFLLVDVENKIQESAGFMRNNKYDLSVYVPADNIPSEYLGNAIPTTVILDKKGALVTRMEGGRNYNSPEIKAALNELVQAD